MSKTLAPARAGAPGSAFAVHAFLCRVAWPGLRIATRSPKTNALGTGSGNGKAEASLAASARSSHTPAAMPSNSSPAQRRPSVFGRWLEPLAAALWILFLIWSALILGIWMTGIGDVELTKQVTNPDLLPALRWLSSAGDGIWVLLAAANVYLSLVASEGLKTMRTRAAMTLVAVWAVCALSTWKQLPFGPIHYTTRLGVHLGPVPFGLPLLWLALIHGARSAALHFAPKASHGIIAVLTALLCLLSSINLEPIAWKLRAWWIWYPLQVSAPAWPPIGNFLTWLIVPGFLAFSFRELEVAKSTPPPSWQPIITFGVLNGVFLLAHLRLP